MISAVVRQLTSDETEWAGDHTIREGALDDVVLLVEEFLTRKRGQVVNKKIVPPMNSGGTGFCLAGALHSIGSPEAP